MKKKFLSMLLFVVLVVSCVALTGCGGKKDNPTEPNDGQQSATTTETQNPVDTEVTEPTTEVTEPIAEPEEVTPNAVLDADGYYTWTVGNYTLKTRTNVYDYIDESDGKWNANDMALAIGWGDWTDHLGGNNNEGFKGNDLLLKLAHSSGACNGVNVFGTSTGTIGIICNINTANYSMNNTSFSVSIEYIVITAYAMENFSSPSTNPFAGTAPSIGGYYRFDQ